LYLTNKGPNQGFKLEGLYPKRSCKNDLLLEEPASKGQKQATLKNIASSLPSLYVLPKLARAKLLVVESKEEKK
jgi:hypothetical protein